MSLAKRIEKLRVIVGRLVILSGPSCVGKGPLLAALKKLYPETARAFTELLVGKRPAGVEKWEPDLLV